MPKWSCCLPACVRCVEYNFLSFSKAEKYIYTTCALVFKGRGSIQTQATNQTRQQDRTPLQHAEAQHHGAQHRRAGHQGRPGPHSNPPNTTWQPATNPEGRSTTQQATGRQGTARSSTAQHHSKLHRRQQRTAAPGARISTHKKKPRHNRTTTAQRSTAHSGEDRERTAQRTAANNSTDQHTITKHNQHRAHRGEVRTKHSAGKHRTPG